MTLSANATNLGKLPSSEFFHMCHCSAKTLIFCNNSASEDIVPFKLGQLGIKRKIHITRASYYQSVFCGVMPLFHLKIFNLENQVFSALALDMYLANKTAV